MTAAVSSNDLGPGSVWLVNLSGQEGYDAAITWSYLEKPGGEQVPLSGLGEALRERPWQYLSEVFGSLLKQSFDAKDLAPDAYDPRPPGLGIPAALEAFNRKERGLLFAASAGALTDHEAHGPSLTLARAWADQLEDAAGWTIPSHAWMALDYHLSWLHGALSWAAGTAWPRQRDGFPSTGDDPAAMLVTGDQEDADAILAWTEPDGPTRILVVEAKGHTAWSNHQMTSKLSRLKLIHEVAVQQGLAVEMKVVLTSPRPPQHLTTIEWPDIALRDGDVMWIRLPAPGMRLATGRCTPDGQPSAAAVNWRIKGPN